MGVPEGGRKGHALSLAIHAQGRGPPICDDERASFATSKGGTMTCLACGKMARKSLQTTRLSLEKCSACGTFLAQHSVRVSKAEPWESVDVSPSFLSSLSARRALQSNAMIKRFRKI